MIRAESFAVTTEDFAAGRKKILTAADDQLRPHIKDALSRIGLPSWQRSAVDAALDVFDKTARAEVDAWGPVLDDMRDAFAHDLGEALTKTKRVDASQAEVQLERITAWVSTMSVNAGTEAATTADPNPGVGLEWITMGDKDVRHSHKEANGQTVPTGHEFEVAGEKLLYPGQPVGDPSVWINCRCVVRPTMLTSAAGKTITAGGAPGLNKDGTPPVCKYCEVPATQYVLHSEGMAFVPACDDHIDDAKDDAETSVPGGEPDPGNIDKVGHYALTATPDAGDQIAAEDGGISTTCVIVALPAESDPISAASSEADGAHCTLLFLGDTSALDRDELAAAVATVAAEGAGPDATFAEKVSGSAVLGKDSADVVLIDAAFLSPLRAGLLGQDSLATAYDAVEQFPTWLPHVTLGYPATPRLADYAGDAITFDRLALWFGEDRTAIYPLGGNPVSDTPTPAEVAASETVELAAAVPPEPADAETPAEAPADKVIDAPADPNEQKQAVEMTAGQPWYGVLAPEGVPSGDGRQFAANALSARELPLPLKYMPIDDEGHKGSFVVARIDRIWRENGLIKAEGVFDTSLGAEEAARQIEAGMFRGVSVDLDKAIGSIGADGESVEFTTGRISSATLCAIPAFAEAFIALGTWADNPDKQAPGEMTITDAPALVASAAVLDALDFDVLPADAFRDPELEGPTPLTVTEDGRVFGHIATWDTCHIGYELCTTAPPSMTDYAYFLTGEVFTDAGHVAVGQISLGGGHASGNAGLRAAVGHYDSTSFAAADVTVGEDAHGIWFAGLLRPDLSEANVRALRAAALSGDWRTVRVGGKESYEMVAALAVNVPGFPIPRPRFSVEGGRQMSLVAAGIPTAGKVELDAEFVAKLDAYHAMKKREEAVAKFRSEVRAAKAASVKTAMLSLKGN